MKIPKVTQPNLLCMVFGNGPFLDVGISVQVDLIKNIDIFASIGLLFLIYTKWYNQSIMFLLILCFGELRHLNKCF